MTLARFATIASLSFVWFALMGAYDLWTHCHDFATRP